MSLVRLLTAGKSLVGLTESVNRYRVTSQRLLPKFEAAKNPFHTSLYVKPQKPCEAPGNAGDLVPRALAAAPGSEPGMVAAGDPGPAGCRSFWNRRTGKLKAMFARRRPPAPSGVMPGLAKPLVQAELSLEAVQVMRNDLSDTDLEVVVAKTAAVRGGSEAGPAVAAPAASGTWGRVTSRLFAAVKR
jgi:hypothetical protein